MKIEWGAQMTNNVLNSFNAGNNIYSQVGDRNKMDTGEKNKWFWPTLIGAIIVGTVTLIVAVAEKWLKITS